MTYQAGTISQIHQQLVENDYHIAKNTLRVWVRNGTLKAAFIGNKAYISYQNVLSLLENGTPDTSQEDTSGGIRRIAC